MQKYYVMAMIVILLFVTTGCESEYQGKTAEAWFNEYDICDANSIDLQNQISDLEVERDDLEYQYDEAVTNIEELEEDLKKAKSDYDDLKTCVLMEGEEARDCYFRY